VSPKLPRLLLVATVAAGFGILPMQGASAAAQRGVDVQNMPVGFSNGVPNVSGDCKSNDPNHIPVTNLHAHDSVIWHIKEGTHNITPAEDVQSPFGHAANWPKGAGPSGDKNAGDDVGPVTFNNAGLYFYYSSTNGEGADNGGHLSGMCGVINVDVDTTPTTTTTTPPATTPDTQPPATTPTTSAPSGPALTTPPPTSPGTHAPTTAAPAPTTTTAKPDKTKQPKDSSTTTTTAPPAINIPPEAIIPDIGGSTGSAAQNGVVQPSSTPSGDAVALIKHKHSDNAKKMLILTGLGIGALGIGAGAYKWANRSSKYFPA